MNKAIFEEITYEDLPAVLEIYNYYVLSSTATFHIHKLSIDEMKDVVFFENPKYKTFIISQNEGICGYVLLTQHKKREAYDYTAEVTVYLKHDCVARGLGSQAVTFIEEFAKVNGFHVLVATICGENKESLNLFEKNGYEKCAHYKEVGKKFGRFLDLIAYQKIIS